MVKQRENHRTIKERRNSEGILLCLIPNCNNLRVKYKTSNQMRNYCSEHTYNDLPNLSWQNLREQALKRDNYVCVKCGSDGTITKKEKDYIYGGYKNYTYSEKFVVDHIKPIALGGDEWDINNLQTLCFKCNKIKTREDIRKIANLRKSEKSDLYNFDNKYSQKELSEVKK